MKEFTDKNGKKKSMTDSTQAYEKLSHYDDMEVDGKIPEDVLYKPKEEVSIKKIRA